MELQRLVVTHVLDELPAEDLVALAQDALMAGHESPSLRELAGARGEPSVELRAMFSRALSELGIPAPTPEEAGRAEVRYIARDVVLGRIAPYDGAKAIWTRIYTRFPHMSDLRAFVGYASEYEDDRVNREAYSKLIVEKCRKLLDESR